jgi:N-acyl homoserine lactone hydrolase
MPTQSRRRRLVALVAALTFVLPGAGRAASVSEPTIELWRLDCGSFITKGLTDSCYLIRHEDTWMLWDAGLGAELRGKRSTQKNGSVVTVDTTLVEQLARLGLQPAQIGIAALSHVHGDHVGQAASFPSARLLVGRADWTMLTASSPSAGLEPARLASWIDGKAMKELIDGDKDVFGDGTVMMLAMPGHTPGHHVLLVRLRDTGPVLLTGDLYYAAAQRARREVPVHVHDAAVTRASFRAFEALAEATGATVIVQHERADIGKLPGFPQPAR